MEKIRVLLIDDSAVVRGALRQIIDAQDDMQVVGTASNGRLGLEELARVPADVVMLDIEMPELDGLSTLPLILRKHPRIRVIMASSLTQQGAQVTIDALAQGAADYVTKPTARAGPAALASLAEEIVTKIRALGGAKRRTNGTAPRAFVAPRPAGGLRPTPMSVRTLTPTSTRVLTPTASVARIGFPPRAVAIASSTGGPNALVSVLRTLPASLTLPVFITQHMPPLFTSLLAQRLQRESKRPCVEATDGMPVLPGHAYLAPGDFHMLIELREGEPVIRLSQSAPENHCRPAADPMLRSVSRAYGSAVLAVVLTGMGEDGRRGCEDVRRAGGRVLIQDEQSSVVWGMPGAVAGAGLADWTVSLPDIGARIGALCQRQP